MQSLCFVLILIAGGEHMFRFFSKAPWMDNTNCSEIYEYKDGYLIVKTSGIYIVHSSVG